MNFRTNQAIGIITKLPCLAIQGNSSSTQSPAALPGVANTATTTRASSGNLLGSWWALGRQSHVQGLSLQPHPIHT